jgi:hypothetical protein
VAGGRLPRRLVVAALAAVALVACGAPRDGESVVTAPDELGSVVSTPVELPSADVLAAGLSAFRSDVPVRVTTATGQTMRMPTLGVDTDVPVDLDTPTVILDDDRSGRRHFVVDMSTVMGPLLAATGLESVAGPSAMEGWALSDAIVLDTRGLPDTGTAQLGPLMDLVRPGLVSVDLSSATDDQRAALVEALVGTAIIDPVLLAQRLPAVIVSLERDPADPTVYRASTRYGDLLQALGTDSAALAKTSASGVAQTLGLDIDTVAAFYGSYFDQLSVDVVVTIRNGVLTSLAYTTDMSTFFSELLRSDIGAALPGGVDPDTVASAFDDVTWVLETVVTFEIVPSLVIEPPPGPYQDRTAAAQAYADLLNS